MKADPDSLSKAKQKASSESRGEWGSQAEFFLSLLGYSVGIGNLVRYPYLCIKSGGAAFVIPFFLAHIFCGIPLFVMELMLGQFSGQSPCKVWNFCPLFKGIGYSMTAMSTLVSFFYIMLIAYCLFYLFSSFTKFLPWQTCDNWWNSEVCWDVTNGSFSRINPTLANTTSSLMGHAQTTTEAMIGLPMANDRTNYAANYTVNPGSGQDLSWASDEYWHRRVLGMSSGIHEVSTIQWELVGCLLAAWIMVFFSLAFGIKWTGKIVYVTATAPYIFLVALVIRGSTLKGAWNGLSFYMVPQFSKLLESKTWIQGCSQMFYSLGPGCGALITMASYNPFRHNCYKEGIAMPLLDMVTAMFGGLAIFSVIGFMSSETGLPVEEVARSGPGLSFIVYPLALSQLPGGPAWSAVFFLTLITLAIDSMFGYFETLISCILDLWPRLRKYHILVVGICCSIGFLCGLVLCTDAGMYFYQVVDWYACVFTVPLVALLESVAIFLIYGMDRFSHDIQLMVGKSPGLVMKVLWYISMPVTLFVLVLALVKYSPPPPKRSQGRPKKTVQ